MPYIQVWPQLRVGALAGTALATCRCCPRSRRDNSCVPAGRVATPPAAGPFGLLLFCGGHHSARCSSCDLLFCGGHHSARWDTYKCPFGGPQHLCAARRSTNNDRLYQQLHRGCQPLSTIAFAALAALYLQQSLSPLLRPRLCPLSVPSAAAGSPIRQLVDYQPLHSTFNNRFRRLCGPLPSTIALAAFAAETVSFLCRSGVLLPGPQAASWTTSLYTLPSTIAFASTNANPTWPQLRGALAGTALATCVAAAALVQGGTVPSIPVSLRVGSPLRPLLDRVATPPALSVLCGGRHSARWPQPQLWPGQLCVPSTGGKSQCASPPLQLPCSAVSLFFGRGSSPVKRKSVS